MNMENLYGKEREKGKKIKVKKKLWNLKEKLKKEYEENYKRMK